MIAIVVPDRGDRPKFIDHLRFMLSTQTMQPDKVIIVNDEPLSKIPDLTRRVRQGFKLAESMGCECVLIMENDDYYSPDYIETMVNEWHNAGKPELFGTASTIYYHIIKKQYSKLNHPNRASLMNTLVKCGTRISWSQDSEVFLDLHLWRDLKGKTFEPSSVISVGIKHGQGLCGGRAHHEMRFDHNDPQGEYLKTLVDERSFNFYNSIAAEIQKAH